MLRAVTDNVLKKSRKTAAGRLALAAVAALACATALSACGNANIRETSGTYAGEGGVAAPYLSVGALEYQVQISRALNPYDVEDEAYLRDVPEDERELSPGEEWFGIFIQVYNKTDSAHEDASEFLVSDTEGHVYRPIAVGSSNLYAYEPGTIPAKGELPVPDSTAAVGPTAGMMLLYKIKLESLEDRPMTLTIVSPTNSEVSAKAELDV